MPPYSFITSFLTYFLFLKLVTYCYAADAYTCSKTPTLFLYGKTILVPPTYMPKLPQVMSTAAVFPLEKSSASYHKSLSFLFAQTSTQTYYHVDNSSEKNPYQKHSALQFHSSTVHSEALSSISSVYISSPSEFDIAPSRSTIYQYSMSYAQNFVESLSSHIYQEQFSSDDIEHTRAVEKIFTSLKPTPDPLTFHLPSVNFHGFSDMSGNLKGPALKSPCELPGNFLDMLADICKICPSQMGNLSPFLSGLLYVTVPDGGWFVNRQFEQTNIFQNLIFSYCDICLNVQKDCKIQSQRMKHSPSHVEETCANVYSIYKCSKCFSLHCQDEYRRLCALIMNSLVDEDPVHHRLNPVHLNSCCSNFLCGNDINCTYEKKEQTHTVSELPGNRLLTSSVTNRHIMEFKTAFVRSNPHLITNVKPKQSAYCRLCETTRFMGSDVDKVHAIAVTSVNLEFPEPRTRGALSTSTSCSKFANSLQCLGKLEETSEHDLFTDDSFIVTTSPPDIVPVPCTKTVLFSAETPYLLSYEVMIDRTVYFSSTWSKQQISKSLSPTLFPEPKTVVSYNLHDMSLDYRTEKQVTLESSFKSFPDILVTGTEIQSVIPIEFSKNL